MNAPAALAIPCAPLPVPPGCDRWAPGMFYGALGTIQCVHRGQALVVDWIDDCHGCPVSIAARVDLATGALTPLPGMTNAAFAAHVNADADADAVTDADVDAAVPRPVALLRTVRRQGGLRP